MRLGYPSSNAIRVDFITNSQAENRIRASQKRTKHSLSHLLRPNTNELARLQTDLSEFRASAARTVSTRFFFVVRHQFVVVRFRGIETVTSYTPHYSMLTRTSDLVVNRHCWSWVGTRGASCRCRRRRTGRVGCVNRTVRPIFAPRGSPLSVRMLPIKSKGMEVQA